MNKAKATIKAPAVSKKEVKTRNPLTWIIPSVIIGVLVVGGLLFDQMYKRALITVDGEKYDLNDMRYYFYTIESQYDTLNQIYGGQYWDMPYDQKSGLTVRDKAKQDVIGAAVYNEVLYKEAVANGYSINAEDQKTIDTDVTNVVYNSGLTDKMKKFNGFTGKYLADVIGRAVLAQRYRTDTIKNLNVDTAAASNSIKKEDYRQYDIEYLYISTQTTDANGKAVTMNAADKKAAYDKLKAQYDAALKSTDWSKLLPSTETEIKYQKESFLPTDTKFPADFMKMMEGMANNSVSDVYESTDGYYIVKMLDNNNSASYDKAVKDAVTKVQDDAFQKYYQDTVLPKHTYKINDKRLSKLTMGSITLVK